MLLRTVFDTVPQLSLILTSLSFRSFLPFLHRRSCCFSGPGHPLTDPDRAPSRGSSQRLSHLTHTHTTNTSAPPHPSSVTWICILTSTDFTIQLRFHYYYCFVLTLRIRVIDLYRRYQTSHSIK